MQPRSLALAHPRAARLRLERLARALLERRGIRLVLQRAQRAGLRRAQEEVEDQAETERHQGEELERHPVAEGAASEEAPLRAAADRLGDLPLEVGRGRRAVQAGQGAPGLLQLGQRLLAPGAVLEVPLDRAGLVR